MPRSRWTSLGLAAVLHVGAALVLALVVGRPAAGVEPGRTLTVELMRDPPLSAAAEEPVEAIDPIVEPDLRGSVEPRLPDAAPLPPAPLPADDLPACPEDACDLLVLAEVPVRVVGVLTARPAPDPTPAAPAAKALSPLAAVHQPRRYPPEAIRRGLEGRARVAITIGASGHVVDTRLATSSGHRILDEAAIASARQWRFQPPGTPRHAVIPFLYDLP